MGAPPHSQQGPRGDPGAFSCDIAGGVADAKDENVLAGQGFRRAVMAGMKLLAGESRSAGKGWLRILRIPVMAVGDQHGIVSPGAQATGVPPPDRDVPAA